MIKINNLSKTYLVWRTPFSRLFVPLLMRVLKIFSDVLADRIYKYYCYPVNSLKDINISIERGDSLGIIGLNGSGKSTLLQIVAGTLRPTSGSVEVKGRIAALLELGSGFDPEFTGKENVYLNASILGLSRHQIDECYNDIISFADIGDFINHPVKTYSSGMMVRLAFAVQVHVNPDVLIVDEALSVGDARFQAKALAKIEDILKQGTTLLFVGHDLGVVRAFCNRAMLLEKGRVVKTGLPDDVITDYLYAAQKNRLQEKGLTHNLRKLKNGFLSEGFEILTAEFEGAGEHAMLRYGHQLPLIIRILMTIPVEAPYLILDIVDHRGTQLGGKRIAIPPYHGVRELKVTLDCTYRQGVYRLRMRLVNAPSLEQTIMLSRFEDIVSFEMLDDMRELFTGLFPLPMQISWGLPQEVGCHG